MNTAHGDATGFTFETAPVLTPGERRAVGLLQGCTGTLIAPRWVLTSAHCPDSPAFCVDAEPEELGGEAPCRAVIFRFNATTEWQRTPGNDLSLMLLHADAPATPIPVNLEPVAPSIVGAITVASGASGGTTRSLDLQVTQVREGWVETHSTGGDGICFGDSGGPLLGADGSGNPVVIGVHSDVFGEPECEAFTRHTRPDARAEWLRLWLGQTGDAP